MSKKFPKSLSLSKLYFFKVSAEKNSKSHQSRKKLRAAFSEPKFQKKAKLANQITQSLNS